MQKWDSILTNNYEQMVGYLVSYVPQLLGALVLLLIGWGVAFILARIALSAFSLLIKLANKLSAALQLKTPLKLLPHHAHVISKAVFWFVIIFFCAAALSSLGLEFIATWLSELLSYLPNVLAGVFIVLVGILIGSLGRTMTEAAMHSAGIKHANRIGLIAKWTIVGIGVVVGIEQLGIKVQFITTLVVVEAAVFSFGIALAYGLGSREFVQNLVGSRQAIKHLKVGEYIKLADYEGKILSFTSTGLELESQHGRTFIPAKLYSEYGCEVITTSSAKN